MDEISNKTLATLLVVAIVISLAGTFFAMRGVSQVTNVITGAAGVASGNATVYINETASIILLNNSVDFGSGYRNASIVTDAVTCNLTSGQSQPSCWVLASGSYAPRDFLIENDGNIRVNVSIKSGAANGAAFFSTQCTVKTILGGSIQNLTWKGTQAEVARRGCNESAGYLIAAETEIKTTEAVVCTNLSSSDTNDRFNVTMEMYVPAGPSGSCSDTVTFTAVKNY